MNNREKIILNNRAKKLWRRKIKSKHKKINNVSHIAKENRYLKSLSPIKQKLYHQYYKDHKDYVKITAPDFFSFVENTRWF